MKHKLLLRIAAVILLLLTLCVGFASCGGKSVTNDAMGDYENYDEQLKSPEAGKTEDGLGTNVSTSLPTDRKIIKTFDLSCETKEYESAVNALQALIKSHEGYVEYADTSNQSLNHSASYYARRAHYTLRIPAERAEDFVGSVGSLFNVTSNSSYVEDVSESYYSIEARLEELQVERRSLLDILERSETKEDYTLWTTVHARLSEVTQQIAVYQGQINRYDSQIAYSTVELSLIEVINYSEVNTGNSYADRLGTAFREGWNGFVTGVQDFTIWFAESLPVLILLAILLTAIILIVRLLRKKKNPN